MLWAFIGSVWHNPNRTLTPPCRVLLGFTLLKDNAYPSTPPLLLKPSEMVLPRQDDHTTEITVRSALYLLTSTSALHAMIELFVEEFDQANQEQKSRRGLGIPRLKITTRPTNLAVATEITTRPSWTELMKKAILLRLSYYCPKRPITQSRPNLFI